MPIAIGAAVAGSSILGSVLGGHSASSAAQTQADAADRSAALQANSAKQSLDFQKQQYAVSQQEQNPFLQAGYGGLANLESLLGIKPQGNTFDAAANATAGATPTNKPRYSMGDNYKGSLFNSWGGSDWKYSGQSGQNDVYTRTNGSPAYDFYGPAGWSRGGAGTFSNYDSGTTPLSSLNGANSTAARSNVRVGGTDAAAAPGTTSLASLVNPELGGFGSLMQPYSEKFTAPTDVTEKNDPGYQFRLQEGQKALQNSAAAKGTLLNGATGADIQKYGQDYASNEYGNVYNRALGEYQQRYNLFQNDQTSKYNRLASLAGLGQTTASQLNSAGQNFANSSGTILANSAYGQGREINNAAAARASGYGAYNPVFSSVGSSLASLSSLYHGGSSQYDDYDQ